MSQQPAKQDNVANQPQQIQVIDVKVEICGKLNDDQKFKNIREKLAKQSESPPPAGANKDQKGTAPPNKSAPPNREGVFFNDNDYEIVADFKAIPPKEIYCRISEGCVEIGAIHNESEGTGPDAKQIQFHISRLYQTPKAVDGNTAHCYVSSDGVVLITGPYKDGGAKSQKPNPGSSK